MSRNDESFLARWSRLKKTGATVEPPAAVPAVMAAPAQPAPAVPADADVEAPPPLTLADVEALAADADFRPFLQADVAPEVHRAALRKLWASDPIITTHDGLTDYAEDFSFDPAEAATVRTIWQAGNAAADYLEKLTDADLSADIAAATEPPTKSDPAG